ncbi:MAG: cytidylate kinase-like family protein [bacterium]
MDSDNSLSAFAQLAEDRVREWKNQKGNKKTGGEIVITISREPGSGGDDIAEKLSAELGWDLYNKEIVEKIADNEEVATEVISTLDEKTQSDFTDWLSDFLGDSSISSDAYLKHLRNVIFAVAAHGKAVILGRGANFFIPPERRISIRLVAPINARINNIIEKNGLSEKLAKEYIAKKENEQRKYVKKYFNADIENPCLFNAIFNTSLVKPEIIIGTVKEMVKAKKK